MTLENRLTLFAQRVATEIDAIKGGLGIFPFVIHSATPPANPTEGMLWRELNAQGQPVEPWPWQRFGVWWASTEVQRVQRAAREVGGNATLVMDDAGVWPTRLGKLVTRTEFSVLRLLTNVNVSTWRIQFLVRTLDGATNAVVDHNPIGAVSPTQSLQIISSPNFGWSEQARLIALNVFRLTGTGQIDILFSADVRALRVSPPN